MCWQILPDGTVWLPNLVEKIVEVATGPTKSLLVDKKLIEGPNANQRGKIWIPLLVLFQVCASRMLVSLYLKHCLELNVLVGHISPLSSSWE